MNILYRDNTILHVPLSQAHLVSRYIGLGSKTPELNKLGDSKWQRRQKIRRTIRGGLRRPAPQRPGGTPTQEKATATPRTANGCGNLKARFPLPETPGPAPRHRPDESGHGTSHPPHGPPDLRRRGLRKNGSCHPRRLQMRDGEAARRPCWSPPPYWRNSISARSRNA